MSERSQLRRGSLSFLELLATSIALIGPSMTPVLIAPYMYANAGNGAWLAYVFGGVMLLFVALNLNVFMRRQAGAGSMYLYASETLGPSLGALAGWTLLWSYSFVAAAVFGAMGLFVGQLFATVGVNVPAGLTVVLVAGLCWYAAYRGVQISAIVMLVLETISVAMIAMLIGIILVRHGFAVDMQQVTLKGVGPSAIGLGIATAIFSLVGFESATAFGGEARSPLTTIPSAVILSVIIASGFFLIAVYAEILALHDAPKPLDQLTSPLGTIAQMLNLPYLRIPITIGALCSAFSVALACITTSGRIALSMARTNVLPRAIGAIEPKHGTPHVAATYATAVPLVIALMCLLRGIAPIDIFNYCGTLSSCGFIIIYALIAIAAPVYAKRNGGLFARHRLVSVVALVCLFVPAATLFYPVPAPPSFWFPYVFVAYLVATWLWSRSRVLQPMASD